MSNSLDVKICGLTDKVTVNAAVKAGASHLGFIFYPPSPRSLTPKEAGYITSTISNHIKRVAVIVDARDDLINDIIHNLTLDGPLAALFHYWRVARLSACACAI